ncbi:hypothetical protein OQA88_6969 [Cercophora sp. LCS_1]
MSPWFKTFRGNCHCTAFVFEIDLLPLESAGECNCSICQKKGYLWVYGSRDQFRVVKGDENDLSSYSFGDKMAFHKFCPKCATPLICASPEGPNNRQIAINARAIQGVDPWEWEITPLNGKAFGKPYEAPEYEGPDPKTEIEGGKMYHGSCHCGAVTLALKSLPLDKKYPSKIIDCNCSHCLRNGYLWVYVPKDAVVLQGEENIGRYTFSSGSLAKTFCKTCGVNLTNDIVDESDKA